ncbi:MAG: hypothetical protein ACTSYI_15990 [Promethearchaeota archaeon]
MTEDDPDDFEIDTDPEEVDDATKKAGERVVTVDVNDNDAQINFENREC